jgi:hypothetical protein
MNDLKELLQQQKKALEKNDIFKINEINLQLFEIRQQKRQQKQQQKQKDNENKLNAIIEKCCEQ